jgi:hypothetical protein
MEWNHLYSKGAMEDQDPRLLAYFDILFREKGRAEKERQEKHEAEMKQKQGSKGRGRVAGRRR